MDVTDGLEELCGFCAGKYFTLFKPVGQTSVADFWDQLYEKWDDGKKTILKYMPKNHKYLGPIK